MFRLGLAAALLVVTSGFAMAGSIEVQTPNGQTAVLYEDFTWEYNRPAPEVTSDTVDVARLVGGPAEFRDLEVVVTGRVSDFFGAIQLLSPTEQGTLKLHLDGIRRADQIKLEEALSAAATTGTVRVQMRGKVEQDFLSYQLMASDLLVLD